MNSSLEIPGYKIGVMLWRIAGRVVYRACRLSDGAEVSLETVDALYPKRHLVAEIRREASITQQLSEIDGVRKIHQLLPHGSGNLVLVADLYDSTLSQQLAECNGQGLPLNQVIEIALSLVDTLGAIHNRNIVHKALAPQHILFNTANSHVAIAGLTIASELDQERQAAQLPKQLAGTLPYMSPEQTGRMNRDLDYRSDYYSLGVLLFELLTGQRPFRADDALEWVYSHICHLPPSPSALMPLLPEVISEIVLKLLAKCPEERYQSFEGLRHDLKRCANLLAQKKPIKTFVLAEKMLWKNFWSRKAFMVAKKS